jgi:methanesulfonate monooxygenase large subunit
MSRNATRWESPPRLPEDHYVDASIYTSQEIFEEERRKIFALTWKFVCHESEMPNPGDFRAVDHAGVPLVVVRGPDGVVRTFINACSHRGAMIVTEPRGNAKAFNCFFHLWSYDTQGRSIGITREQGYRECGLRKEDCGLRAVKTAVKLGMVFVNMDDNAESLDECIGDMLDDFAEPLTAHPLEVFHLHRVLMHANWKQWQETNMELYHEWGHVANRATSIAAPGYHDRKWRIHPRGHGLVEPFNVQYGNWKGFGDRDKLTLPGLAPGEIRLVNLFPNTTVVLRATVVRIDTSIPIAPGVTLLEQRGLGIAGEPSEDRAQRRNHHNQFWGPFGRTLPEDIQFVEAVERSNRNGGARYGIFARHENLLSQDDEVMRAYYRVWSDYMGRKASDPMDERRSNAVAA